MPSSSVASAPPRPGAAEPRKFDFARDTFAFANELLWEYTFDTAAGTTTFSPRKPKPEYVHRCFVLTRVARQFFYHARFDPSQPVAPLETERAKIRQILARPSWRIPDPRDQVVIPGHESLRRFSQARESLLKAECGAAWRSYFLRSHWRMIFPISPAHQLKTADRLSWEISQNRPPVIHLVRFPALTINHGMVLFDVASSPAGRLFSAYDPNDPSQPASLQFDTSQNRFHLPPNRYWPGGPLDIIEICRNYLF
jgi:hypothetical protein